MKKAAKTVVAGGAALAAIGAALFSGRKGARRRDRVRGWALRKRADVMDQVDGLRGGRKGNILSRIAHRAQGAKAALSGDGRIRRALSGAREKIR